MWHACPMTFNSNYQRGSGYAKTGSGGRRGVPIAAGGGLGGLVLIVLFIALGGNPADLIEQSPSETEPDSSYSLEHCNEDNAANKYDDCRVEAAGVSVNRVWKTLLPEQAGLDYTEPGLVLFRDATQSGCGYASSATGPFYCPVDQTAYFDTTFFEQLNALGGNDAPFTQMYVTAHEFGHHVQQIEGTLGLSNYNDPGEDSAAVAIEMQADCYAGVWAHYADKGENALLEPLTEKDVIAAIETAQAIGDDNIQRRSGGDVNPDTWTHGSSEQRKTAFMSGYQSGKMSACDTLNRGVYNG
ncbi:neutral zinc metallopeptidase [Corynebacterium sp. NML130628]|uniref:KPN_02809 family neutral zinc metallopeptidase n=1 Tax=Corynebacterium sp. NML130628 TaxID=1906333 RepID=UPI002101575D|nr:neutral zinc metallopeptidase [Corynebacterium sp. NML130628]